MQRLTYHKKGLSWKKKPIYNLSIHRWQQSHSIIISTFIPFCVNKYWVNTLAYWYTIKGMLIAQNDFTCTYTCNLFVSISGHTMSRFRIFENPWLAKMRFCDMRYLYNFLINKQLSENNRLKIVMQKISQRFLFPHVHISFCPGKSNISSDILSRKFGSPNLFFTINYHPGSFVSYLSV